MRIDARNLLDRLGRSDFNYKEFEDRFTDLELWPILEALLRDPRLQALDQGEQAPPASSARGGSNTPEQAERAAESVKQPIQVLFSRYEHAPEAVAPSPAAAPADSSGDIRALLRRLSAAVEPDGSLNQEGSA
jgi:hypothetical protein